MTGLKVKICGLRRKEDIRMANLCRPDYIGFVFAESRRRVTEQLAWELRNGLDPDIPAVGVFVNEKPEIVANLCAKGIIQAVQLHGEEEESYIRELNRYLLNLGNIPVIKAIRVRSAEQVARAQEIPCDMLLLDAYVPGGVYGGTGTCVDRNLLPEISTPFFLAGGLSAENLVRAVEELHPYGVDISSGVETDGYKDENKMREVLTIVRSFCNS